MSEKIPLGLIGANGKMGQTLTRLAGESADFTLTHLIERSGAAGEVHNGIKLSDQLTASTPCAFIDFSTQGVLSQLGKAVPDGSVYVLGTTALSESDKAMMKDLSTRVVLIAAENMSFGVTLLASLVKKVSGLLDENWDIEISETHHRDKKDSPSGTALLLGRAAAEGRSKTIEELAVYDRNQKRPKGKIGFASTRGGNVVGTHRISFFQDKEALHFTHEAFSRDIFALGALHAARWGWGKKAGLYHLNDVVGLDAC